MRPQPGRLPGLTCTPEKSGLSGRQAEIQATDEVVHGLWSEIVKLIRSVLRSGSAGKRSSEWPNHATLVTKGGAPLSEADVKAVAAPAAGVRGLEKSRLRAQQVSPDSAAAPV